MQYPNHLHPYQLKAVNFILSREHCALWLGLGLGKTVITLTALEELINSMSVSKVLVIAPLRVCNSVWAQEIRKWDHTKNLQVSVCTGSARQRTAALMQDADIFVINRENVDWLVNHYKKKWPFDCVVIDEASSFKNSKSKRWRALKKVRPFIEKSVQLTGSPAANGLVDLWSQIYLLDLGERLGRSKTAYLKRFFQSDYMGWHWEPKLGSEKLIYKSISDLTMSLQSQDYIDLPEQMSSVVKVCPSQKVKRQYKALEKDFVLALEDNDITPANAAALSNKLLQFCNGAVYDQDKKFIVVHDLKIDALKEIIEDNPAENILVAYNYKSDLARIKKAVPYAETLKSQETINRWNSGQTKILLVHPASAGHGLNLQAGGSLIVWFGLNWSLELYQQLNGRLYRQGQQRPVRIIHLVTKDMLDEKVLSAIENKARTQVELLSSLKETFYAK